MTKSLRCYEIPEAFREQMARLVDAETGEISEAGMQELDELIRDAQHSALNLACYTREIEYEALAVKEMANNALERVKRLTQQAQCYRQHLLNALDTLGRHKVHDHRISLSVQNNPPSVLITHEGDIPPNRDYWRVIPEHREPDRVAIREFLKAGRNIAGCSLVTTRRITLK